MHSDNDLSNLLKPEDVPLLVELFPNDEMPLAFKATMLEWIAAEICDFVVSRVPDAVLRVEEMEYCGSSGVELLMRTCSPSGSDLEDACLSEAKRILVSRPASLLVSHMSKAPSELVRTLFGEHLQDGG